ncbi:MAG: peptidase M28, partial [Planctomycetota bacterium]
MLVQKNGLVGKLQANVFEVDEQAFQVRHRADGLTVKMVNLIGRFRPEAIPRFLIRTQFGTRPFPDA